MFIAALFTIVRTQKQPKCPSTEEWIKKMQYIYIQCNITQPHEIVPFPEMWMDLEIVIQSEVSQKRKNKYCICLYLEFRNMVEMNLFAKQN